jgi:putative exporter of polyketide antibiotics
MGHHETLPAIVRHDRIRVPLWLLGLMVTVVLHGMSSVAGWLGTRGGRDGGGR